jgi:hypothetical protein
MNPVEEMIQNYVARVEGTLPEEEWEAYFKKAEKYYNQHPCAACVSADLAAIYSDPCVQAAFIKRKMSLGYTEEKARLHIEFGIHARTMFYPPGGQKHTCGKGDDDELQ